MYCSKSQTFISPDLSFFNYGFMFYVGQNSGNSESRAWKKEVKVAFLLIGSQSRCGVPMSKRLTVLEIKEILLGALESHI